MKKFQSLADVPRNFLVAPTTYFAPRRGKKPVGGFEDNVYYKRGDESELLTPEEWRKQGRKIKAGAKPLAVRGGSEPIGVYADWQTA
jgi:hypothetical protein